ncbi:MAG: GAF domain-containing protein [Chloroflexota bacterium]
MTTASSPEQNLQQTTPPGTDQVRPRFRRPRRLNLGVKLPLIVILMLILAFLISTFLSVRVARTVLIETLQGELTTQTASRAELIRSDLVWARNVAIDLAALAEVAHFDEDGILRVIENTLGHNPQIFGSTIAYEPYEFDDGTYYWSPYYSRSPNGSLRFTQLGNPEYDYFRWDWYTLPKESGKPVLSPPYFDEGGGEIWMVTWSAPFFDGDGNIKGVATADIAFSRTQTVVSSILVGETGYAFLLDESGTILGIGAHGGLYQVMEESMRAAAQEAGNSEWLNLISAMTSGKSGFLSATDLRGRSVFVAYAPVELNTGWSLALVYPQTELFQKAVPLQNTLIIYAILIALIAGVILYSFTRSITEPLRRLTMHASNLTARQFRLFGGQSPTPIQIQTRDELEDLAHAFNRMSADLADTFETLEQKVEARTRDLERRSVEFETIAQVARDIATVRDLDTLLSLAAKLIQDRFGYYHVGIFITDERHEYAVLRAASSVAARAMLERHHRLRVGEVGLVGYVASTGLPRIALDVGADAVHFKNPLLPETRSEIALPLKSRTLTIGVLNIQAIEPSAFDQKNIETLQLLADQLVSAIENAQLVEQADTTLRELNAMYQSQTRQAWQKTVDERSITALEYDGLHIRPIPPNLSAGALEHLQSGKPIVLTPNGSSPNGQSSLRPNTLVVPLVVLNQVIGVIGLEQDDPDYLWTPEELAIAEAAAGRAAIALENARLLHDAQSRAARERQISDISTKIGSLVDLDNIIQTTIQELGRNMPEAQIAIQFRSQDGWFQG